MILPTRINSGLYFDENNCCPQCTKPSWARDNELSDRRRDLICSTKKLENSWAAYNCILFCVILDRYYHRCTLFVSELFWFFGTDRVPLQELKPEIFIYSGLFCPFSEIGAGDTSASWWRQEIGGRAFTPDPANFFSSAHGLVQTHPLSGGLLGSQVLDFSHKATAELRKNPSLSSPDECARACREGEPPKICYYHFTLELYNVLGA
ncbi:hypothetical protein RUM43_005819 [Polyplax serrata]|uniref:Uncharacterized protein n=1 Tax=Polyplax serrata TaxID=468196 RepID=A0AAN8PBR8_POLSC